MQNEIVKTFNSERFGNVRVVEREEEPWFVAMDVCKALEVRNGRDACSRLDEDEKGVVTTDTLGGPQALTIINEPRSLFFGSQFTEARSQRVQALDCP